MHTQCFYALIGWLNYLAGPIILLILIIAIIVFRRKNLKKYEEAMSKSWTNQEEMIKILKEIRDLLKK